MGSVSAGVVFRTLSNTYNGAFFTKTIHVPYLVTFFCQKAPLWMFDKFVINVLLLFYLRFLLQLTL